MRLYLLGAVFLYLALACNANPIILNAEDDKAAVQLKGEIQEESQGVFKTETSNADSANIEEKKLEETETEEATTTELEVAETTTAPVKKVKTGE